MSTFPLIMVCKSVNLFLTELTLRQKKIKQEVGDDLSVCALNILPKNLVNVEIYIFQTVM